MDIQPGSTVTVKVTKRINSDGAGKTLARVFMKDAAIAKSRHTDPKHVNQRIRAGRIWKARPKGTVMMIPDLGEQATVLATVDVIRDLQSVARFVSVN